MKHVVLMALCTIAISKIALSQNATVCKWNDDKKAAVVLTFDDWSPGQYPVAVPELSARGVVIQP